MTYSSVLKATTQLGALLLGTGFWWQFQFLASSASYRVDRIERWTLSCDGFFLRAIFVLVGGLSVGSFIEKIVERLPSLESHSAMLDVAGMDIGSLVLLFLGQKLLVGVGKQKDGSVRRTDVTSGERPNPNQKLNVAQIPLAGIITYFAAIPAVMLAYQASLICIHYLRWDALAQSLLMELKEDESVLGITISLTVAVIIAPITEEVIYRAGVFRATRQTLGPWAAYAVSSALFALSHWNLNSFCPLLILGFVLAMGYERTGRIGVPIVAHALFNLSTLFTVFADVNTPR